MRKKDRIFLWLSPLPILLALNGSAIVTPLLETFLKGPKYSGLTMFLSWLPVDLSLVISLVMMIIGLRFVTRAWKDKSFVAALLLTAATILASVPILFLLLISFCMSTLRTWSQ